MLNMTQLELCYSAAEEALNRLSDELQQYKSIPVAASYTELMIQAGQIAHILARSREVDGNKEKNRNLEEKCTQTPANHSNATE